VTLQEVFIIVTDNRPLVTTSIRQTVGQDNRPSSFSSESNSGYYISGTVLGSRAREVHAICLGFGNQSSMGQDSAPFGTTQRAFI
jgi:hypothetical protein